VDKYCYFSYCGNRVYTDCWNYRSHLLQTFSFHFYTSVFTCRCICSRSSWTI